MANGSSVPGWVIAVIVILALAVGILGYMVYNINANMGVMDAKGRELRSWAAKSAVWSTHVNADHLLEDHTKMKVAPTHIPPPPDPPPDW